MDFVAIDFETANSSRTSACSLAVVKVVDNRITDTWYSLIKPDPLIFDPYNVMIHGITESDVASSPTFNELWPTIHPIIENQIIVAHNASFDISVLRHTLDYYELINPSIDILCSYRLSQKAYPTLSSYRLNVVCKYLGIPLDHHNALSDAQACAQIVCNLANESEENALHVFKKEFSLSLGFFKDDCYEPCRCQSRSSARKQNKVTIDDDVYCYDDDFHNKNFVFTGTLLSMKRAKAQEIVLRGGGFVQTSIKNNTDFLVVGLQDISKLNGYTESSKMRKAAELKEQGYDIQIIGEDDFINMIDDELYNLCFVGPAS